MSVVFAAHRWRSNAELIEACAQLGYLKKTDHVLDPTYGRGTWWQKWRPDSLVEHTREVDPSWDFRRMPYEDDTFDAVAFDPPYVAVGGRRTSTLNSSTLATGSLRGSGSEDGSDFHRRYGLVDAPKTPIEVQGQIDDGLTEALRVTRPRGFVLVKCQDYISGGKLWEGVFWTQLHAKLLGAETFDIFEHVTSPRPQPNHARQVHARRNLSTLLVLRKGRNT